MAEILFLPDVEPLPIAKGDRVTVNSYDWERGEVEIAGQITKVEHETAWVLIDDGLVFPVPLADCSRMGAS